MDIFALRSTETHSHFWAAGNKQIRKRLLVRIRKINFSYFRERAVRTGLNWSRAPQQPGTGLSF
jgi:hypothetical protein